FTLATLGQIPLIDLTATTHRIAISLSVIIGNIVSEVGLADCWARRILSGQFRCSPVKRFEILSLRQIDDYALDFANPVPYLLASGAGVVVIVAHIIALAFLCDWAKSMYF